MSVCPHVSPFLSSSVCTSPFLSLCPHFCLYVPISVCLSPFPSIYGAARLPIEPHLGFIHPPPPKISRLQPIPAHNPHPNPPPGVALHLLWVSYRSRPAFRERLGVCRRVPSANLYPKVSTTPPPPSAPHLPPLQPHCSYAGCCDPGAEPAALLCGQNSSPLSPCG